MRIIAGSKRRLPLKTVSGREVRPTSDRIKETLFNMIQDEIYGRYVLDLFAGSGQIGLEAVSRGAAHAVFVDNSKKAAECILENIRFTKSENECRMLCMDVCSAISSLEGNCQFDLIFLDPPYGQKLERRALECLAASSLLKEDALVIVEAALGEDFSYLGELRYTVLKEKKYKTNLHMFLTVGRKA